MKIRGAGRNSAALTRFLPGASNYGFLQIPGRELDRPLWFDTMAIFTFIFPWLNIAAAPLALFVVYLVVVLFVTY